MSTALFLYKFLKDCGILDEIKNKFKNLVNISIDDEDCKLTFYGLKRDVENCKVELIKQLEKINSTRLTFLEDDKIDFLTRSKGRKNPEFDVVQFIKSRFRQNNLKCVLQCSSEPKLRYSLQSDLDGGKVILDEIIQCRNISLGAGLVQLLDTEEWKKFEKNLCLSKTITLKINMKNSSIILIGVAKCVTEGEILLNEFVKKNIVQHKMIEMSYSVSRFLSEYPKEVELEEKLKNIEWHPTSDGGGGIMLHGKAKHITTALTNVEELISSIKTEERDVSEPGIPGYFRDSPGRQFLKTTESITKCIILVDKANNNDLKLKNANPKSILQQHLLAAATCSGRLLKNLALKLFSIFLWLLSIFILTIFERILKVLTFLRQARFYHTVYVQVKKGDILTSNCDVIVNLTGSDFDLTRGQLSAKLVAKAGTGIVQECSTNPQYSSTHYRVTSGGGLNCKNVLHLVSPKDAKYVSKSLKTAFEVVEKKLKLSSVAVPAIGTGNLRLLPVDIAKATQDALDTFAKTKPSFLRRIDIVIFQASMLQDFQKIILAGSNNDHNINKNPFTKKHESIIPKEGFGEKKDSVKLSLCAANQINIINAWQRIREHVHQKSASREITDETVPYLDEEAEKKLIALETNLSVKLRKSTDILGKQKITLLGIKDNVMEAYSAASEVVQEYKQIVTCAEYVIWQYHDRKSNTWKNLPRRENWKTENAYKKNEKGSVRLSVKVGSTKQVCVLDFSKMEATCLGFSEQIYRNLRSTTDLPTSWSDMNGFQWLLENVPQNSKEHQNVLSQFSSGGLNISQAFVQRVQNPTLYKQFIAQKGKVEARMKAAGITNIPVTQQLFHGTSADVCQKVYKDGFDRSYAGKNATMYGRGVYFAKTAQYSNGYATPDANGQRRMFLAEVVTGEYCKGNQSVITPPMKPNQTDLYDSVVDNPSSPSIFVVFKDASVYPLYVLTY
ncbi:unnamed protein product [Clavelina lepadiformis]|uniref:Poly [ADP-ribose] polymerase n=1 Tax=Clavelina lepadiformis TaxID=159417 RepID=A0ABP0GZT1_CLALP